MPQVQTSYTERHVNAYAGMIANPQTCDLDSGEWEDATAGNTNTGKFGYACQQGTAATEVKSGIAAGTFRGILVIDKTLQPVQDDEYTEGDVASVLWRGDVWVPVESAVVVGGDVTVKATTGQLSSAAAAAGQILIAGARWMTAQAVVGGLAKVRLAGPVPAA